MKNYFNKILPPSVRELGDSNKYYNVLTRTSINGIFVGHPGIISGDTYDRWSGNANNSMSVCFPFTPSSTNNGHNVVYNMLLRDIVVVGESNISDVKTIRSHNLSVKTIRRITKQITDRPIVFEAVGKDQASRALNALYKFTEQFEHVRLCNKELYDSSEVHNHSLYIEIYPMNLCIPIYDTKNVDGFGIVTNIIGNNGLIVRCIASLVSKHRENLFVIDGSVVCNETKMHNTTKSSLMKTIKAHCARTASIHNDKSWSINTNTPTEKKYNDIEPDYEVDGFVLDTGTKVTITDTSDGMEKYAYNAAHGISMPKVGEIPVAPYDVEQQKRSAIHSELNISDTHVLQEAPISFADIDMEVAFGEAVTRKNPIRHGPFEVTREVREDIKEAIRVSKNDKSPQPPVYKGEMDNISFTEFSVSEKSVRGDYKDMNDSYRVETVSSSDVASVSPKSKKKKTKKKNKNKVSVDGTWS